jgi:glutathione S-transferase
MPPVKLHRCSWTFLHTDLDACWKVQRALDEQGIDYEVVKGSLNRGNRGEIERMTGQKLFPVIEFEDGTVYRDESKAMVERIRSGQLMEGRTTA